MNRRRFVITGLSAAATAGVFAAACSRRGGLGGLLPDSIAPNGAVGPVSVLRAQYATFTMDGKRMKLRTYNGRVTGPTIVTRPGATLSMRIVNALPPNPPAAKPRQPTLIPRVESSMETMDASIPRNRLMVRSGAIDPMNNPHDFNTTNLHVHGIQTVPHLFSPIGTGNPSAEMLAIEPGKSFQYDFPIPRDHPSGLHWYHPHHHGSTDVQVSGGMAGLLVVRGDIDEVPEIKAAREIFLVVQTLEVNPSTTTPGLWEREPIAYRTYENGGYWFTTNYTMLVANGKPIYWIDKRKHTYTPIGLPQFNVRPGEVVRLRLLNGTNYLPLMLALPGFDSWQIGFDGVNTLTPLLRDMSGKGVKIVSPGNVLTAPIRFAMSGNRIELLLRAPAQAGNYKLTSLQSTGLFGDVDALDIAEFVVAGKDVAMQVPSKLPVPAREYPAITAKDVKEHRSLIFNEGPRTDLMTGFGFTINGQLYDEQTSQFISQVGTAEEWRVVNKTADAHPFHLHTNSFQLIAVNDKPLPQMEIWDTFLVPPRYNGRDGSITFRVRFKEWFGKDVFHCHIISHEDTGMMMNFVMA